MSGPPFFLPRLTHPPAAAQHSLLANDDDCSERQSGCSATLKKSLALLLNWVDGECKSNEI